MSNEISFPVPVKQPVVRSFHGDDFVDNYEWFREENNPQVKAHIEAENAWFAARTAHLQTEQENIAKQIASHTKENDVSPAIQNGEYWYWTQTWEGKSYPALYRVAVQDYPQRPDPALVSGEATLVYDANELAQGQEFFAIGAKAFTADGKYCALGVDYTGGEQFQLRIHEVESGTIVDESVRDLGYGICFSNDGKHLYYLRNDEAWRSYQLWRHEIGTDPSQDQLLFQEDDELFTIFFSPSQDGKWLVLHIVSTLTREERLFSLVDVDAAPILVSPRRHGLDYAVEVSGDHLVVVHNLHNQNFTVATAPLGSSEPEQWQTVLEAQAGERINGVAAFANFLAVYLRQNGGTAIQVLPRLVTPEDVAENSSLLDKAVWGEPVLVPKSEAATVEIGPNYQWHTSELVFLSESLLQAPSVCVYEVNTGEVRVLKQEEVPGFNAQDYREYRMWATAEDGTQIPLTVVHHVDVVPDGTNPTFVYGYGSYEVSIDPWFDANRIPIFSRGIVYAIAHVRGGGEMGRAWYEGGKFANKPNSFSDFVAATKHLVAVGLADPQRIAAEGRSAGGLLMGAVTNLAPELYRVVHAGVPFVDALTTILKPELPLTVGEWEEWGNPIESAEIYEVMKSYSPYENIKAVEYPAILATTSINDVRVSFVEPTKWVAKLRETVTNDQVARPIVMHTEMVAGHGGGSGRYKRWESRARELAFIFDQLGLVKSGCGCNCAG